jgi:hypothetical protein
MAQCDLGESQNCGQPNVVEVGTALFCFIINDYHNERILSHSVAPN